MFAVAWRHNANSPWVLLKDMEVSEPDARAKINQFGRYDMVRREYRIIPLGEAETWHDPIAEQAIQDGTAAETPAPPGTPRCQCGGPCHKCLGKCSCTAHCHKGGGA